MRVREGARVNLYIWFELGRSLSLSYVVPQEGHSQVGTASKNPVSVMKSGPVKAIWISG